VIKALDIYQINSDLIEDCYQSLVKLAKYSSSTDAGSES
jgi:hypothetical protein